MPQRFGNAIFRNSWAMLGDVWVMYTPPKKSTSMIRKRSILNLGRCGLAKVLKNIFNNPENENAKTFLRQNPDVANAIESTIRSNAGILAAALSHGPEKDDAASED